MNTHIKLYI